MRLFPHQLLFQPRLLLSPSTLFILVFNLLPLAGVLFWNWDAFVLLTLYWAETAVAAFWVLASILLRPRLGGGEPGEVGLRGRILIAGFFAFHSGLFMLVHFMFLWMLFSGEWSEKLRGPVDFVREIFIGSGLWLPLLIVFIGRGIGLMTEVFAARRPPGRLPARRRVQNSDGETGGALGPLYLRIVILHVVILVAAFLAQGSNSVAPFLLLILFRTVVDVGLHISSDARHGLEAA